MQDVVERIWDFIDDFNINSVLKFLRDNIVGTVVLVSLLFWVPISCLISYVDRKRAEKVWRFLLLVSTSFWHIFIDFFYSSWSGRGGMGVETEGWVDPPQRPASDNPLEGAKEERCGLNDARWRRGRPCSPHASGRLWHQRNSLQPQPVSDLRSRA